MICPRCHKDLPDDAVLCCYCARRIIMPKSSRKRGNGEGTAYKRGSTWTVKISASAMTDAEGRLLRRRPTKGGFRTKSEALAYAQTLKNGPFSATEMSMDKVFTEWAEGYSARISASTMAGYRAAMKHYAAIAVRPIRSIRPAELQAQIDACKAGKRTKQLMKVVAGLIWKFALDNDLVPKNITANLYTGNDATSTRAAFDDLELKKIRQAVGKELYADYVVALCYTGFRPGELLKLRKEAYNRAGGYIIGGGKTEAGTDRIVTVPPAILDIVKARADSPGEFLFPNLSTGKEMTHEYFRKYCFDPLMEKLGITGKVPYSCRHTYSNLIKLAPGDTGDKARLMGHTDYAFTQARYQSSALDDLRLITDALK